MNSIGYKFLLKGPYYIFSKKIHFMNFDIFQFKHLPNFNDHLPNFKDHFPNFNNHLPNFNDHLPNFNDHLVQIPD